MTRCHSGWLLFALLLGLLQAAGCGKRSGSADASGEGAQTPGPAGSATADAKPSGEPVPGGIRAAHDVLEKMAAAYRNAPTYEDFATAELWEEGSKEPAQADFKVAFERPNKLRMKFYQGELVCDGKKWFAYSKDIPYQAVLREAPEKIKLQMLQADVVLNQILNRGFAGASPQLPLLLEEKPLPMLLDGVRDQDLVLDEPGRIGDYDCYRVRFNRSEGSGEYWIDQKTFVLRRMRFDQPPVPSREGEPAMRGVSMVVNFERARLGGAIDDASVFKVVVPEGTQCHRALLDPGPYALVGTKLSEFQFTDLQGKPWSSQAIAGKSAVIYFWKSDITEADPMIATIEQFYGKYKENDKLAILAVTLDHPDTPAKTIEEAAKQLKINVPLLRETGIEARDRLRIVGAPTTLFIDAKGVLQDCIIGYIPTAAAAAPRKLERLLAGEDLAQQTREEFQRQFREIEKAVDIQFSGEAQTAVVQQARPTPAAAKREPVKLRLKPQWKCEAVRPAGNILVTKEPGAAPRIFVIEDFRSVSEIGVDGKRIATYKPQIAKQEFFINLRSGAGRDGKRYFVAFAPIEQRFHLFDEKFNLLLSYPADALENRHAGLSDVELGDLNGDGVLKAYVGFAGPVGVKCVSLQGRPIWSCRTLFNIGNVVPGPANAQGQSELYCVNDFSSVAVLDSQGRLRDAVRLIAEGTLQYLTHGDLSGNGAETWCGIMFVPDPQHTSGKFTALGMNPNFTVAWKYALPSGTEQAVEPVVVGRLLPGAARQWILPGCDGSIHVLAGDGTLIDRFNYGEQVNGLATVEIDGKPVLLISSANGVEALRVE